MPPAASQVRAAFISGCYVLRWQRRGNRRGHRREREARGGEALLPALSQLLAAAVKRQTEVENSKW